MSEPMRVTPGVTRDDLRVIRRWGNGYPEWSPHEVTPAEFDQIARAEGYLRLEGIDVEALRLLERGGWSKQAAEAVRQVLAALDGEGEAT